MSDATPPPSPKPKQKREMTPARLEQLKKAREKALEAKARMSEISNKEQTLRLLRQEEKRREQKQKADDLDKELNKYQKEPEEEEEEVEYKPKPKAKPKPKQKRVVYYTSSSSSSSSEEEIVYKPKSTRRLQKQVAKQEYKDRITNIQRDFAHNSVFPMGGYDAFADY